MNYTNLTAEQQKALDDYVKTLGVPPGPPTQQGIYATPEFTGDPYPTEVLKPVEENQEPPEGWPRNPVFNAAGDVPGPPVQFGPAVEPATVQAAEGFTGIGLPENDIFYFHPDHLGSTSYISTRNGSTSQHVEYIAFGEILFEEHSSSFSSPYLFNGKELDRETNLSYYGARYLDMKTSLWLSVDPLALYNPIFEKQFYFDGQHNGGVYNSMNLASYSYCYQNPINLIDPNGKQVKSKAQTGWCEGCHDIGLKDGDYSSDVQNQVYTATVQGVSQKQFNSFKEVFTTNPGKITTNTFATYKLIDRDGNGKLSKNDHIDIDISGPDNASVRVNAVSSNSNSFSANFVTLEGHTDAGFIYFSGSIKNGVVTFTINNTTRTNTDMSLFGAPLVSRAAQKAQWRRVMANFGDFFKKPVSSATQEISEYDYNDYTNKQGDLEFSTTVDKTKDVQSLQNTKN